MGRPCSAYKRHQAVTIDNGKSGNLPGFFGAQVKRAGTNRNLNPILTLTAATAADVYALRLVVANRRQRSRRPRRILQPGEQP
jgi:hypothetical protein